jgi:ATP-dependent DNA helicase RecQ
LKRCRHLGRISPTKRAERADERSPNLSFSGNSYVPTEFHRTRTTPSDPSADLTPDQQLLDAQLRAWRKAQSELIGLPQFFVLGASTLRSIVLERPRTLAQLQTISGIGPEKANRFGADIIALCRA